MFESHGLTVRARIFNSFRIFGRQILNRMIEGLPDGRLTDIKIGFPKHESAVIA